VRAKLPLQKSSFSPATAPEKCLIASVVMMKMTDQLGTPRGGMMSTAASFPQ
jgi:hypothetical protein